MSGFSFTSLSYHDSVYLKRKIPAVVLYQWVENNNVSAWFHYLLKMIYILLWEWCFSLQNIYSDI